MTKKRRAVDENPEALEENYVVEEVVGEAPDAPSDAEAPADSGDAAAEAQPARKKKKNKKKKDQREEDQPAPDEEGEAGGSDREASERKPKKAVPEWKKKKLAEVKAKAKEKKQERFKAARVGHEIATRSAEEQAAWWAEAVGKKFGKEMAEVELAELRDDAAASRFAAPEGQGHALEALPDFLVAALGDEAEEKLGAAPEGKGSPTVVTVSSSGARAMDVLRALRRFGTAVKIGKLFAKHFKLEEQIAWLKQHPLRIAVGTPKRLEQLIAAGALSLDACELLVYDMAEDAKGFTVLDLHDTRRDALALYRWRFHQRALSGDGRVALF